MSWIDERLNKRSDFENVDEEVRTLWHEYLVTILGIPENVAIQRIQKEIDRKFRFHLIDNLASSGWQFDNSLALDLGCGTGALASVLLESGSRVIGLDPSTSWAHVAQKRLHKINNKCGQIVISDGSIIPLPNQSMDYVFSLQVLEHVPMQIAKNIIHEISRVLHPEGRVFLTFENYVSFWEPHYRVRWFPNLPKAIGSAYLRVLGRNPKFLRENIFYNSAIHIMKTCFDAELISPKWLEYCEKIEHPELIRKPINRQLSKIVRLLSPSLRNTIAVLYAERANLFQTTVVLELGKKIT